MLSFKIKKNPYFFYKSSHLFLIKMYPLCWVYRFIFELTSSKFYHDHTGISGSFPYFCFDPWKFTFFPQILAYPLEFQRLSPFNPWNISSTGRELWLFSRKGQYIHQMFFFLFCHNCFTPKILDHKKKKFDNFLKSLFCSYKHKNA